MTLHTLSRVLSACTSKGSAHSSSSKKYGADAGSSAKWPRYAGSTSCIRLGVPLLMCVACATTKQCTSVSYHAAANSVAKVKLLCEPTCIVSKP
jgi:hypothetical protein